MSMIGPDSIIQVNSTIIVGLLIFITITSLFDLPITRPIPFFSIPGDNTTKDLQEKGDLYLSMTESYISSTNRILSLLVFLLLLTPFAISSVFILMNKTALASTMTAFGFALLLIIAVFLILIQYQFIQNLDQKRNNIQSQIDRLYTK